MKEQHVVSQAAIDHVLSSTTTLVSSLLDSILSEFRSLEPEEVVAMVEQRVTDVKSMFSGLSTSYQQQKYFSEHFNLVVTLNDTHAVCLSIRLNLAYKGMTQCQSI